MNLTTLFQSNSSCTNCTRPSYDSPTFLIFNMVISITVILLSKLLILLFLWKRAVLLKTPSNYLLLSLLKCNLLKGIAIALQLLTHVSKIFRLPSTRAGLIFRVFADLFNTVIVCSMAMQLCGVTLDRYIALYYSYRYENLVTVRRIARYIMMSWLFPLSASLIQLLWLQHVIGFPYDAWIASRIAMFDTLYSIFSIIIFLVIPMSIFVPIFIAMFIKTRTIISSTQSHRVNPRRHTWFLQFRAIYMFTFMSFSFVALVTPYFLLRLLIDITAWQGKILFTNPIVYYWTSTLQNLTPLVNSVFYVVACPKVQKLLKQGIRCCFKKGNAASLHIGVSGRQSNIELQTVQTEAPTPFRSSVYEDNSSVYMNGGLKRTASPLLEVDERKNFK